jgi:eukaryotic-like serine/threonine-protein kinase
MTTSPGSKPALEPMSAPALGSDATERLKHALAGRYRIERELGTGGMATVYLAHDLRHDRRVAVKVLKPELAAVLGAERFVVEIKTTASLQHPHILPLFDSGTVDGFLYYVMPFIDGETLRTRLDRETQLGVEESVRITSEVADALDYAHRHGVIHRDIKPENILLHDGRPIVADFGIALAVSAAAGGRMTETGLSLGTPHYMSPEQATADKDITGRTDIYSLASVLYEMLAGQPPHLGGSAQQIIMKIIVEPVEPVTKLRKTVPPHVAAAIAKALEKLPADRFESAKAFASALANPAFASATAALPAPTLGRQTGVPTWLFALTAGVAVLAVGAAAWSWLRPKPAVPVSRFSITVPDSLALSSVAPGAVRVALSPDGRMIAYVGDVSRGRRQIYLRRLDRFTVEPIPGTDNALNPAFSPDGKRLAFVSGEPRAIKVVSLTSGGPAQVLTDSLVDTGGLTWSNDGYLYYDGHLAGDGLARVRDTGGKPEIASRPQTPDESWHSHPSALPNGRGLLFSVARLRGASPFDIAVLDSRTGEHRVLFRGVNPRYAPSGHLLYVTDDGSLMAIRFDIEQLTTSGEPVAVASGVTALGIGRVDLQVAPDLLVYVAGGTTDRDRELVWVARDGKVTAVHPDWRKQILTFPAVSPDGRAVALGTTTGPTNFEVWVKQLDRGPASKLADVGLTPTWLPNGTEIAFWSTGGVFVGPADGSVLPRLRYPRNQRPASFEYSPDGEWIVASVAGDVIAFRTAGDSATVPLVTGPAAERSATISHDGRWMAYASDEGGRFQIYVRPFPAVHTAKRQVSVDGGTMPRWSRDGRELFYLTESGDMMSVPVTLAPTFSAGTPRVLFNAPFAGSASPFTVHPDGKRFLMTRRAGANVEADDQIVAVQNYAEELRARLPR